MDIQEMIEQVRSKEPELVQMRDNALRALGEVEGKIELQQNFLSWLMALAEEEQRKKESEKEEWLETVRADVERRKQRYVAQEPIAATVYPEAAQSVMGHTNGSHIPDSLQARDDAR